MRAARDASAIAFEREGERLQMIAVNAANLGTPMLRIENGDAPDSLIGMPAPDAIFLGGAVANETLFHACWTALRPGGRLVANAVTLEGEQALYARHARLGGELLRLDIAALDSVGSHRALRPRLPVTQWSVARNQGNGFGASKVAFSQEWSFQQDPQGPPDPAQIQPELGVAVDYNQDGRMDVLLYDVYGNRNNHIVLLSKPDGTFEEIDTGIQRPFPLGPAPKQLRGLGGSVHIADIDGDGVGDLIQCEDHGNSPQGAPSQSVWTLHLWRPGGFEATGASIEPLAGFTCATELRTIDVNRNGKVDLVLPGMIRLGGTPTTQTTTYSSLEQQADGTWKAWDTKLPIPPSPGRVIWADVNADGLPDAIANGLPDGRLRTWMNRDAPKCFRRHVNSVYTKNLPKI